MSPPDLDDADPLALATRWRAEGHRVALATVVRTWGSSPRPAGSQLVIRDDQTFAGSVSGGCIEGAVVEAGLKAMAEGAPCLLEFGISNDTAWSAGLACGGQVQVYVEPIDEG